MRGKSSTDKLDPVYRMLSGLYFAASVVVLAALVNVLWNQCVDAHLWAPLFLALWFLAVYAYVSGSVLFVGRWPSFFNPADWLGLGGKFRK